MIKGPIYLEIFPLSGSLRLVSPSSLFLFVMKHHLATACVEVGLEVTSVFFETTVPSVILTMGARAPGSRGQQGGLSRLFHPISSQPPNPIPDAPFASDLSALCLLLLPKVSTPCVSRV